MPDILVIGSMNMDMTVFSPRLPISGETMSGDSFLLSPGGKGANQAIAASRLGSRTTMLGRVGEDAFGDILIKCQKDNGVTTDRIARTSGVSTGVASITVVDGANSIIVVGGANDRVRKADIDDAEDVIARSDAVLMQLEIPLETVAYAAACAKKHQTKVFLNPAPARPIDENLLRCADYLVPNEHEAAMLLSLPRVTAENAGDALLAFRAMGVATPIITLGSAGVAYLDGDRCVVAPCHKVRAVDTTAAGDTFIGALATAVTGGMALREAIDFAQRASAICVTRRGASAAIPTADEVRATYAAGFGESAFISESI